MIKVTDILKRTLTYINEYSADVQADVQSGEVDAFGSEAREDLLTHIDAAARMVAQLAPANMQVATTLSNTAEPPSLTISLTKRPDGRKVLTGQLPADYMRLVYLTAAKLFRPITVLLPSTHPTYAMQYCPIAGIGAGDYAPIGYQVDGVLEVHSVDGNVNGNQAAAEPQPALTDGGQAADAETPADAEGTVAIGNVTMCYLSLPKVESVTEGGQTFDAYKTLKEELKDVVAMQAAALYLGMNESEKAGLAQQMATAMLNQLTVES